MFVVVRGSYFVRTVCTKSACVFADKNTQKSIFDKAGRSQYNVIRGNVEQNFSFSYLVAFNATSRE